LLKVINDDDDDAKCENMYMCGNGMLPMTQNSKRGLAVLYRGPDLMLNLYHQTLTLLVH
jgi:hypothetical protein